VALLPAALTVTVMAPVLPTLPLKTDGKQD